MSIGTSDIKVACIVKISLRLNNLSVHWYLRVLMDDERGGVVVANGPVDTASVDDALQLWHSSLAWSRPWRALCNRFLINVPNVVAARNNYRIIGMLFNVISSVL